MPTAGLRRPHRCARPAPKPPPRGARRGHPPPRDRPLCRALAQLVEGPCRLPPGDIDLIHIRDWHDPDDPAQRDYLAQFGAHCIRGTRGARLVLGMDEHAAPNERIVDSLNLNDLEGTDLAAQLDEIPPGRW